MFNSLLGFPDRKITTTTTYLKPRLRNYRDGGGFRQDAILSSSRPVLIESLEAITLERNGSTPVPAHFVRVVRTPLTKLR